MAQSDSALSKSHSDPGHGLIQEWMRLKPWGWLSTWQGQSKHTAKPPLIFQRWKLSLDDLPKAVP